MNTPAEEFIHPLLETTFFRSRKKVPVALAADIYGELKKTPFASLYGMASWFEDFAELVTIYHLTYKMNQPFRIWVEKNNIEIASFEPMKNELVSPRLKQLEVFYR